MLKLENIGVSLGTGSNLEYKALNNLNLDVKTGEFIIIVGSNGAGKSTLLNVISGFIKTDFGKISILDQDITNTSQTYRAKFISKVVQDPKLGTIENMSIFENMAFALRRGQSRTLKPFRNVERTKMFQDKLSMANIGLENRLNEQVSNLSGGQRQILSIIMALLQDSKILLLDEITAALDPASSEVIIKFTNQIIREFQLTCIMITHNMTHAIEYGDRLIFLKGGTFIEEYNTTAKSNMTSADLTLEFIN